MQEQTLRDRVRDVAYKNPEVLTTKISGRRDSEANNYGARAGCVDGHQ